MESYGKIILDNWQKEVLNSKGKRICIRAGRQVGKSTIISLKAAIYAVRKRKKVVLIVAAVERQAQLLFEKTLAMILELDKTQILKNKKPTKSFVELKNNTRIYCVPVGLSGYGIRGFTVDLLIVDEAAFLSEDVWAAIIPMLAVSKGDLILLSTPRGAKGYFYECFKDNEYKNWHVSSEDCPRISKEFLETQKKRMTKLEYAQEFKGEFIESLQKYFPTELIRTCMTLEKGEYRVGKEYYLGLDFARYGGDENAYIIAEKSQDGERLKVISAEVQSDVSTALTIQKILVLESIHHFSKIYLDDGGLGAPILDQLLVTSETRRKVVGLNNASRAIDREGRVKRLLKEDLYANLKVCMEQNKIELIKNDELFHSLESIQFEIGEDGRSKIFGSYAHLTEALIRAAWAIRTKALKIWVHSI